MGYLKYMQDLLRPLELYALDSGLGAEELRAMGMELDGAMTTLETIEREAIVMTASDWGLSNYEHILPYKPASNTVEERRNAIGALARIDNTSFTPAALAATLAGCGISAALRELETPMTVEVTFPGYRGIPPRYEELKVRIEQILPCHLNVVYRFVYLIWEELMAWFDCWESLENTVFSWAELEVYMR